MRTDDRSVEGFLRTGRRAQRYVQLRKATANGDKKAATDFLIMQLEERQVSLKAARRRHGQLGKQLAKLPAKKKRLDELMLNLEISETMRAAGQDRKKRRACGKKFLAMWKNGPRPSAHVSRGFWFAILEHTEAERDIEGFKLGLDGMRKSLAVTDPGKPWVKNLVKRYEDILERLQQDKDKDKQP